MPPSKRRGSRVVYVARSARELPEEVQDWLSQADHPASASPDIYDALALLATGRRPTGLIVHIDAVDWDEMEFFEHAARLSRETRVYVTGNEHQQAKLKAACARGARLFDPDDLAGQLEAAAASELGDGSAGLLAGSLRSTTGAAGGNAPDGAASAERPPVRLVRHSESEDADESPLPVPVPWAPHPHRPRRTPPGAAGREDVAREDVTDHHGGGQHPTPVELTPEELAALLGKPKTGGASSAKEQRL